jgi:hypothetical protein
MDRKKKRPRDPKKLEDTHSLGLSPCRLRKSPRPMINPFTRETIAQLPMFSPEECEAVRSFLESAGPPEEDEFLPEWSRLELADGSRIDIEGMDGLEAGMSHGFQLEFHDDSSPAVASFLFELAACGNMAIGSTVGCETVVVTNPQDEPFAASHPAALHARVVGSPAELLAWLCEGIERKLF